MTRGRSSEAGGLGGLPARLAISSARWWGVFLLIVVFAASTCADSEPTGDERSHFEMSQFLAANPTWDMIRTYEGSTYYEAKAPFLFIVGAIFGSIFGMTIENMRLLSFLFGLIGLVAYLFLTRDARPHAETTSPTALVALPYFMVLAVTYQTDSATAALLFLALIGYLRNIDEFRPLALVGAAAAASAMLWIRVDNAFVIAGIGLACVLNGSWPRARSEWIGLLARVPTRLWIGLAAPIVLRIPLIVAWGGLIPPPSRSRPEPLELTLLPSNLTFVLCVVGCYFAPFALQQLRRSRSTAIAAVAGLAFFFAFPVVLDPSLPDRFAGILRSAIWAAGMPPLLETSVLAVLCVSGVLALVRLLDPTRLDNLRLRALGWIVFLGYALQTVRGTIMYERYLLTTNAVLLVLALGTPMSRWLRVVWLGGLLTLAIAHLFRRGILVI